MSIGNFQHDYHEDWHVQFNTLVHYIFHI